MHKNEGAYEHGEAENVAEPSEGDDANAEKTTADNSGSPTSFAKRARNRMANNWKALLAFVLFATALTASIGIGASEVDRIQGQNQELGQKLSTLQYEHNCLKTDYDALKEEFGSTKEDLSKAQKKLSEYQDQQATLDDAEVKLVELHSQYDALQTERDELQKQIDAEKLEQELALQQKEQQRLSQNSNTGGTVYWVVRGSVYHTTPDCVSLKRSSNIKSGSISASGKSRVCKICG